MVDGRRARGEATRERVLAAARRCSASAATRHTSIEAVLDASGVARGALYHHFASKTELFDAVLERCSSQIAPATAAAARGRDPLESLRAGAPCMAADGARPRGAADHLLDPQAVLGWARWRELDERYWLGGLRASLRRLGAEGRVPAAQDGAARLHALAALNEAALFIAYAEDQRAPARRRRRRRHAARPARRRRLGGAELLPQPPRPATSRSGASGCAPPRRRPRRRTLGACASSRARASITSRWSAQAARPRSTSGRACSACRSSSSSRTSTTPPRATCTSTPAMGG